MEPVPSELKGIEIFQRFLTSFNLFKFALSSFDTAEDLMAAAPELAKSMPAYDVKVFMSFKPDLVAASFHPKNRNVILKAAEAQAEYWQGVIDGLKAGDRKVSDFCFTQGPELFHALGFLPICTATGMAAGSFYRDGCEDAIDLFRSMGFADHYCTVHAAYPGYVLNGNWRVPDVMVKPAAPCVSGNAGYQVLSRKLGVPLVVYDSSYYLTEEGVDHQLAALKRAITRLEKISSSTLDEDVLRAKVEESNRTYALLGELHELRKHKPNPDPGLHRILDILMLVTTLGEPSCTEYFQLIVDEAQARIASGERIIPADKKELRAVHTWAINVYLPEVYHWLEENLGMTYLSCGLSYFIDHQIDTTSVDTMLRGWVQRTMNFPMGRQSISYGDVWVDDMVNLAVDMEADCGIFAGNVACKQAWAISKLMSDKLEDEHDIPSLRFEIECCDKRLCPADEFKQRIESFVEVRL